MSTTTGTGFCRVTVAAPDARIDVALPEDVALVDIYPEILRLSGQSQAEGAPTGYHLVRRDGTVLDAGQSLAQQQILDGDLLLLKPFAESLPLPVFDDVSDAVASAVKQNRTRWSDDLMHYVGLTAGVLLLTMMAFALWFSNPVDRDMHRLPGIIAGVVGIVLVAVSGVRARVYDDHGSSIALGLASLPHLLIAGSGIFPVEAGEGPGRLHLLVGCVVVLIASVLLVVLLPQGDAPFVAAAFLSAIGTLSVFAAILTDAAPIEVAAVTAAVSIALVAWLPGLSARFARLPIGYKSPDQIAKGYDADGDSEAVDFVKIGNQARRGHELLLGLVAGCSALVVGSAGIVLGFSDNMWAQLMALAAGITIMLRARLFDYTAQIACMAVAGILTIVLLILGIALHPPVDALVELARFGDSGPLNIRTVWFSASIAAGAALLVGVGLVVPRKGVTPFWGRIFDIFDGLVLLSLVPLCLAVLDVYATVRGLTGN
ncbi:type VII secretion integral membrane protein EccD [Streptomyces benahoarensis]|uniref:Type VII secretion integral membrane protein EccD n=1 Tax=Streptomyces benahoarensis TaxID=2595054 RepID=A0A553ZKY7_9ACTN|nr:type VII secretion integral membrane protein EccD [Streptomyces benahoarensis]TSB21985.1 type VII secretion integral membrane protein EccD [Streptomyces benahoarensis]TSB42131.1 type VII secretion integral membrane protein EccD [Streptomyces benahoarensis]